MSDAWEKDAIITQEDRELLAQAYEEGGQREQPYHEYAALAREGRGAFTMCSLRAIARARMASAEREAAAWRAGRDAAADEMANAAIRLISNGRARVSQANQSLAINIRVLENKVRALTPPGDLAAATEARSDGE